jgi:dynein heavy chain 2
MPSLSDNDDARYDYIINNASVLLMTDRELIMNEVSKSVAVNDFLNDINVLLLKIIITNGNDIGISTDLNNQMISTKSSLSCVSGIVFVKRLLEPIIPNNISHCIDVHTLQGNDTLECLYHSLKGIWCPILLSNNPLWSGKILNIQKLLSELEESVSSSVSSVNLENSDNHIFNVSNIIEPIDEINFWISLKDDRRSQYRDLAKSISSSLLEISNGFTDFYKLEFSAAVDLIANQTLDALNGAWGSIDDANRLTYPSLRMSHLFDCIGKSVYKYISKYLMDNTNIWGSDKAAASQLPSSSLSDIKIKFTKSIQLLEQWCDVPRKLTSTFWSGGQNRWKNSTHEDTFCLAYKKRLEEILKVRTLADELSSLLTVEEKCSFNFENLFLPLEEANPLIYNPYTDSLWQRALKDYDKAIAPIETAVAAHFRKITSNILDKPSLLLNEFYKYNNLLQRLVIRRILISERETLLTLLKDLLNRMENSVDNIDSNNDSKNGDEFKHSSKVDDNSMNTQILGLSPCVGSIVLLRQLGQKAISMLTSSQSLLNDLSGFKLFYNLCETFISRTKSEENALFDTWLIEAKRKVEEYNDDSDSTSNFRLSGSLMKWKDGLLMVNFSDELVCFIREVRQLDELGFDIPKNATKRGSNTKNIREVAMEAEKYYRYGILLKKTANFYNTISEQMIDVQEQLLLDSLTAFATLVSNSNNNVTWNNHAECESYIRSLQDAADKLAGENKMLRKVHESLCSQTVQLMKIDLCKQPELWKTKWRAIKSTMLTVKSKYSEKDCRMWVLHWENQIYKALESSYQMGLVSLNESLPDIKVELTIKSSGSRSNKNNAVIMVSPASVNFKPPLEVIRQTYFNEMKKFISIPNNFDGFDLKNASVYKNMGAKNSKYLVQIYQKAEQLFDKLVLLISKYSSFLWINNKIKGNMMEYILANIKSSDDYVANFKEIKARKKEIDKITDIEKIDCVAVSLVPLKAYLDEILSRYNSSLVLSLRNTIISDYETVDKYLLDANEKLLTRPRNVKDVSIAKKFWKEIDNIKDDMRSLSKLVIDKKKLLSQYSTGTGIATADVIVMVKTLEGEGEGSRWYEFDISLEAFNDMIEEQKELLKSTLEEEIVNLNVTIDKFGSRWKQLKPDGESITNWEDKVLQEIFLSLENWKEQFNALETSISTLIENCLAFNMPKPRFEGYDALYEDYSKTNRSWDILKEFNTELQTFGAQDWHLFSVNVYILHDFAVKWFEYLKVNVLGSNSNYDVVIEYIMNTIEKIKKAVPALKYCRGEPFKDDHWIELLQSKLQLSKDVVHKINLKVYHFLSKLDMLVENNMLSYVKNLQARALGEVQIREALQELKAWEKSSEIKLLINNDPNSRIKIPLIKDWKDLFLDMGDKQSLLSSLKESQFFKLFSDQGLILEKKMTSLDFILHTLNNIQRKWIYLEPIFGRGSLPSEEGRFKKVNEEFSDIMIKINKNDSKLFILVDEKIFPNLSDKLTMMLDQLERCQKALSDFLEIKRECMPRFYFIGDDDLLEILGQAKNPSVIQSHLKKLFQGINKVKFNEDSTKIIAMISASNEIVTLANPVMVNEKVEEWLDLLQVEMRSTLSLLLSRCLNDKSSNYLDIYPSQILCLAQAIRFTDDCEAAIEEGGNGLNNLLSSLTKTLYEFTSYNLSSVEALIQLKIKALVLDIVHNIDMINQLIKMKVVKLSDWYWKKQLRYYYEQGKTVVRMHDAKFDYTFEYQGNSPKLVHTPLTDKCYLTLTQGMHMGFGGNPYGPAGTGKTESVKALASCMGRQVLVFNCDEALESSSMVRIFIGIIKCGAWGCFDEFNRLKEDQLSAISQQIQVIQDAIKNKVSPINLLGRSVDVNFNSGIFVTLNPAGKGYGGRSRLPDNLKALFRPVAMGAPDNELIAEVSLVTEGFVRSKDLASKIVSLFKLSKQLLSPQQHYDWGLRALKAVLNSGGRLIQQYKSQGITVDATIEYEILIKAVRVNTLSKLTYVDTIKFLSLINDVFPGIKSDDITGGELEEAIRIIMKEKPFYLVEDDMQIKKMIQLKESLDQRMGCVIVGPSGCGKSSLWRVLKAAMIKCGQPVLTYVMNPKSMHRERLLGHMDLDTREWADGVLTDAARKVVRESTDIKCWIICDGDVDPEWIESLNSVLDDNHLLTLPNGERINFGSNVNFLFETHDLKFASPATVSRMGMIFLSDDDLDVKKIIQKWLSTLPAENRLSMASWIDELFYKSLDYVLYSCDTIVDTTLVGTIMNGLSQVKNSKSKQEFICGLIRGLGGNLSLPQRALLGKEIFQWANERIVDTSTISSNPGQGTIDVYANGISFIPFTLSPVTKDTSQHDINEVGENTVIPTISIQRTMVAIENWINNMEPFILVGPEGCGKSMIIKHAFKQKRNIGIAMIHCNAQTTADDVINKIVQTCSLFSSPEGRVYRPRDCERLVLYLKDINLPRPDMYNTCQLIAFLQQLITFDGFYDESLEFLRIERIQIVASMNAATTVGRHTLSSRFTAVVRIFVVDYPESLELSTVYDNFLSVIFSYLGKNNLLGDKRWMQPSERERLSNTVVDIYQKTKEKFTVDERRHYLFTPRDITLLVKNLCRYDLVAEDVCTVVVNESCRIFRDRLVGLESCNRFDQILSSIMRSQFRYNTISPEPIFTSLTSARGSGGSSNSGSKGLPDLNLGGRISRMSEEEFKKLVSQGVMYYGREERDLDMLLFPELLEHISHIDRILSTYGGHILLVGRCGVGRRNAVTIASYMIGCDIYTPAITRHYDDKQFSNDVKSVLFTAGIKGEHIILLIEDYQIVSDSILECVNSLLSAGEVPGMYTHEELEPMLTPLREKLKEESSSNYRTPYDFFVARIKKYLHIVLCLDPGHQQFLYRCESNPALYSQCTVKWISEWKTSSLKLIPTLMDGVKELVGVEDEKTEDEFESKYESKSESKYDKKSSNQVTAKAFSPESLIEIILAFHASVVTALGATPRDYIIFLRTWYQLYNVKKAEIQRDLGHLEAGLSKLDSATEVVNDLKTNAVTQERDLRVAQAAADRAMDEISNALSGASDRRNEVAEVKRTVAENETKTQLRKAEIEGELAEIQPVLEDAKLAVGQIKSDHLNELKSLVSPPEAIVDVLSAVLTLLGVSDLSWNSMKKFLSNRGVKEDILNYDGKKITPDLRKNVAKLMKKNPASFEPDTIKRVSVAAAPMAAWVKANIKYSLVIEKIEPLQEQLDDEVRKLEASQARLQRCEDELKEIDDKVLLLKQEFANRTAEAERLKRNLALAGTTLDKAEKLIGQLSGEQARWRGQAEQLKNDIAKLPTKVLLAAGFATYLAKSPEDVRSNFIRQWQDIISLSITLKDGPSNNNETIMPFSFKRTLSSESELLQWKSLGLPSDDLSQENALVISIASITDRVPFIIDPTSAATLWLKNILSKDSTRPLEVIAHHDQRFSNQVELAVRFGKTLLILEVDGVEPLLYPICRKDLVHQGPRYVVHIGDKVVDYNENFRLYLVTRNPNPDITPDSASLVTQVNFTVTRSGLEGQLLGIAIHSEQPEIEKAKSEMLRKEEDFKVQLAKLEKDLLETLATAEGNLLENTALIESLSKTKLKSAEIEEALVQSAEASTVLDREREMYRPFAHSGSKIYFLVKTLQSLCHMYQFSLSSFIGLFKQSLTAHSSVKSNITKDKSGNERIEEKLTLLCTDLEVRVLHFTGRALFKSDRATFALHLVRGMHSDHFQSKEWEIFTGSLVSGIVSEGGEGTVRGFPSWTPTERQSQYRLLQEHLPHLIHSLELENISKWNKFATSGEAEKDIPALRGVSPFQRVLIVQAFRPDRLQSALLLFCTDLLRIQSISPPPLSLAAMYNESDCNTPLLLLSSPGADASKELQEYATKVCGTGNTNSPSSYQELAMGGQQTKDEAILLIRKAATDGSWVCLKNLHLVVGWLPVLEKELSSIQPNPEFRLWLTSESHNLFPSILLQTSLKATFESPPGIKKNLQRTFDSVDPDHFIANKQQGTVKGRLLFLLSCFHSILQERRTYIPQGWTKFYEFSYGDMRAGLFVMIEAVASASNSAGLDWEAIYGLMEDAIYGGRIDNAYDLRVLRSYLKYFFSEILATDKGVGIEVITGTNLRMPSINTSDYDSFKKLINNFPDVDSPSFFGLPDNIERSVQRFTSSQVIKQLRSLSALEAGSSSKYDREKWKLLLMPIIDQWQSMIASTPGLLARKKTTGKSSNVVPINSASNVSPVDDVVQMEYTLAGEICTSIDIALSTLKKVLLGSGLITPTIQSIATSLLADTVPSEWSHHWDSGPEKPQVWLREIVRKRVGLSKWVQIIAGVKDNTSDSSLLAAAEPICLGYLFHPGIFINALRQQTARQLSLAIDKLKMVSSWEKDAIKRLKDAYNCPLSCTLNGLLLQGASFSGTNGVFLQDASSEGSELIPVQPVTIAFIEDTQKNNKISAHNNVLIPVYISPTREDYIMEIEMPSPSDVNNDKWILAGVAMFLAENE